MVEYYQVWLSAETKKEAREILNCLIKLKLIVGGTLLNGYSHFLWKGGEVEMKDYFYVMGFTIGKKLKNLESQYKKINKNEEVPMASFIKIRGNKKFLDYIYENVK